VHGNGLSIAPTRSGFAATFHHMRLKNNAGVGRIVLVLVLLLVVNECVRSNVGSFFVVEGNSMSPTLSPDTVVRAQPSYANPVRGDVVIVTDDHGDRVMKRIIGLPGETVTLYGGFIYIDRQRINEPYLPRHTYTFKSEESNELPADWRLGNNEYFLLGDNRFESRDSRDFGPVNRNRIHRFVSLPENTLRPGFCGIVLVGSGRTTSAIFSPRRDRTSNNHPPSNAKI
jgi:signal peptidase I